jgi:hypothetical protein
LKAPVSAGVKIAAKGRVGTVWKEALGQIDQVHDDGELAPSKAIRAAKNANHLGVFYPGTLDLGLKDDGPWMHLTAVHELGHYLDHQALGVKGKWASTDPTHPAYEVIDLLKGTPTIAQIEAAPMGGNRKAYFTQRLEIWARAYAQFIAEESGDEALLKNLKKVRESVEPWRQWPTEEFAPARARIRRMFEEKGWMKADEKEVQG